ncbi:hypothetical protein SAMN05444004_11237 [Jannaschia faecimaris]|uniref:Galactose mutarotase n=1 Tax=Jannaschia faecimaris TaxID=1244108 RepID=A0A1H3SJC2_9RHOB|nr:hypothetical protein [Jannaschia faecimaris]SDZ37651.1 hypothetical protein SAMN05444004_11237 [Jannaschia faecimaris]
MILHARGILAEWEASCGHLPRLEIGGASVLWAAPWRDDPAVQSDTAIPVVDRRLGGTFTCAPFGQDDLDGGPPHGLAANAPWQVTRSSPSSVSATRRIGRGHLTARIAVRHDHPVLYQTHTLDLDRRCTFAHHPIIHAAAGAWLSANARAILTFDAEAPFLLQGRRLTKLPTEIPTGPHEDFATLTGATGLGWTALARLAEGDTIVTLRQTDQLPVTNLWFSDGARGGMWRNARGLIGVEGAICAGAEGFAAALSDNRVAADGVPTALPPGRHVIPHAIVRIAGCHRISGVVLAPGALRLQTGVETLTVPFDETHFA